MNMGGDAKLDADSSASRYSQFTNWMHLRSASALLSLSRVGGFCKLWIYVHNIQKTSTPGLAVWCRQRESCISPVAEPRRAGICASPLLASESSCRSSTAEWQQQVNWGQVTYVPMVNAGNGVILQRYSPGSDAASDGPSFKAPRTYSSSAVPSISTYEGMHALVVPCWGPPKSTQVYDQQQQLTSCKDSAPGAGWSSAFNASQRIVQDLVASLSLLKYSSPAAAAPCDRPQQQADDSDKALVLDSGNASELQFMVAAMKLQAMFGPETGKPPAQPAAATAQSSQQIDSLTPVHLEVPYEHVTGVGLCYVGKY